MTLRTAGEAVERLIDAFETELGAEPHQQALRLRVLGHALHYFENVVRKHKESDEDGPGLIELAKAHKRVADLAGKLGSIRREDVIKHYEAAIKILEKLAGGPATAEASTEVLAELGTTYHELATIHWDHGESDLALSFLTRGASPREGLHECPMHDSGRACGCLGDLAVRTGLGLSWGYIGDVHEAAGQVIEADRAYEASHRIRQKLLEDFKDDPDSAQAHHPARQEFRQPRPARTPPGRADRGGHPGGEGDRTPHRPAQEIPKISSAGTLRRIWPTTTASSPNIASRTESPVSRSSRRTRPSDRWALIDEKPGMVAYRIEGATAHLAGRGVTRTRGAAGASQACKLAEALLEGARDFQGIVNRLARARWNTLVGEIALREGRIEDAREPLTRAKELVDSLIQSSPKNDRYRGDRAGMCVLLAEAYRSADPTRASDYFKTALSELKGITGRSGDEGRKRFFQDRLHIS